MEKFFALVLMATLVFTASTALAADGAANTSDAGTVSSDEAEAVVGVVSSFYKKYIDSIEGDAAEMNLRQCPEVDAAFVKKLEDLVAEAEKEDGFLGYDPILMSQDVPGHMEYASPVINENEATAELIANKFWGESKHPICVALTKKSGTWRITDVTDMEWHDIEGEETLECGGLKKAPKANE